MNGAGAARRGCRGLAARSAGAGLGFSCPPTGGFLLPGTLAWTFSSESHPKARVYEGGAESGGVPFWSILWA